VLVEGEATVSSLGSAWAAKSSERKSIFWRRRRMMVSVAAYPEGQRFTVEDFLAYRILNQTLQFLVGGRTLPNMGERRRQVVDLTLNAPGFSGTLR
jgi:hypothetical protein